MNPVLTLKQRPLTLFSVVLLLALSASFFSFGTAHAAACTWTHRVRLGDTLGVIARQYDTTTGALLALNPQITNRNVIIEGADICISDTQSPPSLYGTLYKVSLGDTLATLAQRFGVTLGELARANGIGNPDLIVEGETITVPEAPVVVEPAS